MTLDYVVGGKTKTSRITFDPAIETYDEVKPRLIQMREEALEGVGMVSIGSATYLPLNEPNTSARLFS